MNKVIKKIKFIESHKYAIELNKVHFEKTVLNCSGLNSFKAIKDKYFSPSKFRKIAIITFYFDTKIISFYGQKKVYSGIYSSYTDLKKFINNRKNYHNLGVINFDIKLISKGL